MLRVLLLLLIAAVLACPLRCQAHASASPADAGEAANGCHCCDDRPAAPPSPVSPCPGDDCDCGSCICHGAVLEGAADLLVTCSLSWPAALPVIADRLAVQPAWQTSIDSVFWHRCLYPSGRAARIAHQSLLI